MEQNNKRRAEDAERLPAEELKWEGDILRDAAEAPIRQPAAPAVDAGKLDDLGKLKEIRETAERSGAKLMGISLKQADAVFALVAQQAARIAELEARDWISVEDSLPAKYCLAAYQTRAGRYCIIRAMHVKQYEIEATGDECDSETNDADDLEYIKAGWYECIDNWGDYSSVAVNEGVVTHWMLLPATPTATQEGK